MSEITTNGLMDTVHCANRFFALNLATAKAVASSISREEVMVTDIGMTTSIAQDMQKGVHLEMEIHLGMVLEMEMMTLQF